MSRECILIPKARYAALIQLEENHNKSTHKAVEPLGDNTELSSVEPATNVVTEQKTKQSIKKEMNPEEKTTLKKENQKSKIRFKQHGGGKSYINMTPKQFLNDKSKKLTLKRKWLSFPL